MGKIIFTIILIVFPLGQLIKFGMFNLFDALIFILAIWTFFKKPRYPKWYKYFLSFILFCIFGLVVNSSLFTVHGSLYLLRLLAYSFVAVYLFNFVKNKLLIINYLLLISIASAILGWLQYIFLPDMRFLYNFGWDDHLYRMVGTFFDPAFLGLIFVLGSVIALWQKKYLAFIFLAFSIIFTYSRASYLALLLVFIIDFFKNKNIFRFIILNSIFIILFFVPKNISEGTNFARTASSYQKLVNYKETVQIIAKYPAFGVGFNNICLAKEKIDFNSHSCFGSDNSILFILATTGVIGLILFLSFVLRVTSFPILLSSFLIIILHSMFTNSLFYPHIMFWLFSLIGLEGEVDGKKS